MKRRTKILLLVAAVLFAAGSALTLTAFARVGFDPARLSFGVDYTERSAVYAASEVTALELDLASSDITIRGADTDEVRLTWFESSNETISLTLQDGTLRLQEQAAFSLTDPGTWFRLDFSGRSYEASLTVPYETLAAICVRSGSGSVTVQDLSVAGDASLSASSGDVTAQNLTSGGALTAQSASGRVALTDCAADGEAAITTASGDASLTRLTTGSLLTYSASGSQKLSACILRGSAQCEAASGDLRLSGLQAMDVTLTALSGSIRVTLDDPAAWACTASTTSGSVRLPGSEPGALYSLRATTTSGDIVIE